MPEACHLMYCCLLFSLYEPFKNFNLITIWESMTLYLRIWAHAILTSFNNHLHLSFLGSDIFSCYLKVLQEHLIPIKF